MGRNVSTEFPSAAIPVRAAGTSAVRAAAHHDMPRGRGYFVLRITRPFWITARDHRDDVVSGLRVIQNLEYQQDRFPSRGRYRAEIR